MPFLHGESALGGFDFDSSNAGHGVSRLSLRSLSHSNGSEGHARASNKSNDLTSPIAVAFSTSAADLMDLDTPTPQGQASRAIGAFPFPLQPTGDSTEALSRKTSGTLPKNSRSPIRKTSGQYRDRFIPTRRSPTASTLSFHMSKPSRSLSSSEKLLRHCDNTFDPFRSTPGNRMREAESLGLFRLPSNSRTNLGAIGATPVLGMRRDSGNGNANNRQASFGAIWNVGGAAASAGSPVALVTDGRGGLFGRGTSAPVYISRFLETNSPNEDMEKHESRLALALDVDQASTILGLGGFNDSPLTPVSRRNSRLNTDFENNKRSPVIWQDSEWVNVNSPRILDAPQLRDDFYCSLLAYSPTLHNLAVGLSSGVYLWSEKGGVQALIAPRTGNSHITSLAFSSEQGGLSILAIGRANGTLTLWSLYGPEPRFESLHAAPIACLAWKPRLTVRASARPIADGALTSTEELLVGDEAGTVYYYAVEWSSETQRVRDLWMGAMTLLARITVHTQQICGLAWSADGDFFATGGNDNACCMFETKSLVQAAQMDASSPVHSHDFNDPMNDYRGIFEFKPPPTAPPSPTYPRDVTNGQEKHRWEHRAAVKAIAFCPWQRGLVATGGGSNDRCIHFFHTISGACLATIFVGAQVTSLLWSTTRREIAATFGYAQPDHPYRIAVFSWPDCAQVLAVPWEGDLRALHAIAYPGGPNDANLSKRQGEGGPWASRTAEEGCIVVAASDQSVKFHEVWSECRKGTGGTKGLLGGSDILESLEGIDREGDDVIR